MGGRRGAVYLHREHCQCFRGKVTSGTGGCLRPMGPVLSGVLLTAGERTQKTLAFCVVRTGQEVCVLANGTMDLDLKEVARGRNGLPSRMERQGHGLGFPRMQRVGNE